jgi:hypothetical protein
MPDGRHDLAAAEGVGKRIGFVIRREAEPGEHQSGQRVCREGGERRWVDSVCLVDQHDAERRVPKRREFLRPEIGLPAKRGRGAGLRSGHG